MGRQLDAGGLEPPPDTFEAVKGSRGAAPARVGGRYVDGGGCGGLFRPTTSVAAAFGAPVAAVAPGNELPLASGGCADPAAFLLLAVL